MLRYIIKRVISAIITIWFIMTLTFILMKSIPGDPFSSEKMADPVIIANIKAKYGLDRPLIEQYGKYLYDYAHGDFGVSYMKKGLTTNDIISAGFPYSLRIGIWASVMVLALGIFFGIIAALRQNKVVDRVLMILATLGATIPSFVFATGFLFVFSKILGWVPSFGVDNWKGYIGPVIVSALFSLSYVVRLMRTSTLDVLNQDYIRTARAKGVPEGKVNRRHALRNAMLPVATVIGLQLGSLLGGAVLTESVYSWPGIGNYTVQCIMKSDFPVVQGVVLLIAVIFVLMNLIVDVVYAFLDPRIKYSGKEA